MQPFSCAPYYEFQTPYLFSFHLLSDLIAKYVIQDRTLANIFKCLQGSCQSSAALPCDSNS